MKKIKENKVTLFGQLLHPWYSSVCVSISRLAGKLVQARSGGVGCEESEVGDA